MSASGMPHETLPRDLANEAAAAEAAVNGAIEAHPSPSAETIRSLEAGALVLASLTIGTGEAVRILHRTHALAIKATHQPLTAYRVMSGRGPDRIRIPGPAGGEPGTATPDREFVGTVATTNAIDYAIHTERGIGEIKPLDPNAVATARRLFTRAESDPLLEAGMVRIARLAWERALLREEAESVHETVQDSKGTVDELIEKAEGAIETIRQHPLTENPTVGQFVHAAGKVAGHSVNTTVALAPFGTMAKGHAQKLIRALTGREREVLNFMMETTDDMISRRLGIDGYKHQDRDIEAMLLGMRLVGGADLIPDNVDLSQVAQAIATEAVILYPERIFGESATGEYRAVGVIAATAAAFDYRQGGPNSVTRQSESRQKALLAQTAIAGAQN